MKTFDVSIGFELNTETEEHAKIILDDVVQFMVTAYPNNIAVIKGSFFEPESDD